MGDRGQAKCGSPGNAGEPAKYLSYLLRAWQEGRPGCAWRASLENVETGERRGFPSLEDMFEFLHRQTDVASRTEPDRAEGE